MGELVFITSVGVWLGTVVSFVHVFAPVIRAALHPDTAMELLQSLLHRYYMLGILCGLTGLAGISLAPSNLTMTMSERLFLACPVSIALICTVLAQYYLYPRIVEAHNIDPNDYDRLLRFSALLDNTVLLMLVLAFATFTVK